MNLLAFMPQLAKAAWPSLHAYAAASLARHGYDESLLWKVPLWIGVAIWTGRLLTAPFLIYKDKPFGAQVASASLVLDPSSVREFARTIGRRRTIVSDSADMETTPDIRLEFESPGPLVLANYGETASLVQINRFGTAQNPVEFNIVPDLHYDDPRTLDAGQLMAFLASLETSTNASESFDISITYTDRDRTRWVKSETLIYDPGKNFAYIEHGHALRQQVPRKEI